MIELDLPIYILIDENAKVLSSAKTEILHLSDLPDAGNYYLITEDGLYIVKDSPLIQAAVPLLDADDNLVRSLARLSPVPPAPWFYKKPQQQVQWRPAKKAGMFDWFFDMFVD